jgi:hypothetical protein
MVELVDLSASHNSAMSRECRPANVGRAQLLIT